VHLSLGPLLNHILNLSPVWLLSVAAMLVFLEDAVFIGFVLPGETAAVLAGVGSNAQGVPLVVPVVVIVLAAILGDSVGYEIGKRYFARFLDSKPLAKYRTRIDGAQEVLKERGGVAVFLARFQAFLRAIMPALAGVSGMPYRTFLAWNALGGIAWGTTFVTLGFVLGKSAEKIAKTAGLYALGGVAAVAVIALVVWKIRSEREPSDPS
jgi:membrane protein DedA with SNARE-associated domain